jgi:triosephosphate isomerase
MRKHLIAGNWKMNNVVGESVKLVETLKCSSLDKSVDVLVCPPFTSLYAVKESLEGSSIMLGAQNMHFEEKGAFTGEVSPIMIKDSGAEYVIIGHSERRQYFGETDEIVNKKLKSAIRFGIKPIFCVGETLEQRNLKVEKNTVKSQMINGLSGLTLEDAVNIIIAYEPIWAIGTGVTATSSQANEMASFIRKTAEEIYGKELSEKLIILYGGSVKGDNAKEIMGESDIDGALVGGASLKADEFLKIINFANPI